MVENIVPLFIVLIKNVCFFLFSLNIMKFYQFNFYL